MRKAAKHEPDVADHVDHERLHPGRRRGLAAVPEADQRVGGEADERPADDQQHEVAGQDQQQHREDEEVEVAEVAGEAAVRRHVGDRVEVDQRRDAADDQAHVDRQRVDEDPEVDVEPGGARVVVERRGQLALLAGWSSSMSSVPIAETKAAKIAPVAIQPALRPGSCGSRAR